MDDGAITLGKIALPAVTVSCQRCGRRVGYRLSTLLAIYGPTATVSDFLSAAHRASGCQYSYGHWGDRCLMGVPELSEPGAVRS